MGTSTITGLVDRLRDAAAVPQFGPDVARIILAETLTDGSDWLDVGYQQRDPASDWALYPLYRAPEGTLSVLVGVFKPGVESPVHDHHTWAVVGVYRGTERETRYRRVDDASKRDRARLEVARILINGCGTVTAIPDDAIHSIRALEEDSVSIHVYGTDIVTQRRSEYDLKAGTVAVYEPAFSAIGDDH